MNDSLIYLRYNGPVLFTIHSADVVDNSMMSKAMPSKKPRIWQESKTSTYTMEP